MLLIYHGSGSSNFKLLNLRFSFKDWTKLRQDTCRLLRARNFNQAADILEKQEFEIYDGTNAFGDDFYVLLRRVSIEEYVELEKKDLSSEVKYHYSQVAKTITELGTYIRFIAISIDTEDGPRPVTTPNTKITSVVVERALNDAQQLFITTGAMSAVDRVHTALHGYIQAVCDEAGISYTKGANLTYLFKLMRQNHKSFQELGPRSGDIERIVKALSTIIDSINTLRNKTSVAHPNEQLLNEPEAILVINCVRTILNYVDAKVNNN